MPHGGLCSGLCHEVYIREPCQGWPHTSDGAAHVFYSAALSSEEADPDGHGVRDDVSGPWHERAEDRVWSCVRRDQRLQNADLSPDEGRRDAIQLPADHPAFALVVPVLGRLALRGLLVACLRGATSAADLVAVPPG